jgi:hypothetical protein
MAFVNHVNMFPNIKSHNKEKIQKYTQQRKILNIFFFSKRLCNIIKKISKDNIKQIDTSRDVNAGLAINPAKILLIKGHSFIISINLKK